MGAFKLYLSMYGTLTVLIALSTLFFAVILLLVVCTTIFAGTTGKLAGKVKDEKGAPVPYANIAVMDAILETVTNRIAVIQQAAPSMHVENNDVNSGSPIGWQLM